MKAQDLDLRRKIAEGMQVRIQDFFKGGGASEILPTSHSQVKHFGLKTGGQGKAGAPKGHQLDPHLGMKIQHSQQVLHSSG